MTLGYGWDYPPQYFLEGHNRFPEDVQDLEVGRNYASNFPRFDVGKYSGIVSAPLTKANFEPDLVMIYCNSEQLSLLLLGREFKDGFDLPCRLSSHAACVYSVVLAIQEDKCQVALPCRGDRYYALAGNDEIIFTIPTKKIEDLLEGLRYVEKYNSKLPKTPRMVREPEREESYEKISKMLGCA